MTARNSCIPNFKKFRGDKEVMQFEAQLNTMGTADENGKWNFFLCCTGSVAFGTFRNAIILNRDVTYAEMKTLLNEKFCIVKSEIWKLFLHKTNKRVKFFIADR